MVASGSGTGSVSASSSRPSVLGEGAEGEGDEGGGDSENEDDEGDREMETDQDRRRTLLESMSTGDVESVRSSGLKQMLIDEFILPPVAAPETPAAGPSKSRRRGRESPDGKSDGSESTADTKEQNGKSEPPRKKARTAATWSSATAAGGNLDGVAPSVGKGKHPAKPSTSARDLSYGAIVEEEVAFRRNEALGLVGKGTSRSVGAKIPADGQERSAGSSPRSRRLDVVAQSSPARDVVDLTAERSDSTVATLTHTPDLTLRRDSGDGGEWTCFVCTL